MPRVTVPTNGCIERNREQWSLMAAEDWDAVAQTLAPEAFDDDRRSGLRTVFEGRDAVVENLRAAYDVGARLWSIDPIATYGDDFALMRFVVGGADRESAFAAEMLVVSFLHPDGRLGGGIVFDMDDLEAASAELDTLYAMQTGTAAEDDK
jgi:hypothetical protein